MARPKASPKSPQWSGTLMVIVATALWATLGSVIRICSAGPWEVIFWRGAAGSAALLIAIVMRQRRPLAQFAALGAPGAILALAFAAGTVLFVAALRHSSVADVAAVYATLPFAAAGLAWIWMREPSRASFLLAAALAFGGVCLCLGGSVGGGRLSGDAIAAAMTLAYAVTIVILRRHPGVPVLAAACATSLATAIAGAVLGSPLSVAPPEIAMLVVSGVVQGVLADVIFMRGSQLIPASRTALIATLDTPIAVLSAWVVLGELPPPLTLMGGGLILVAVLSQTVTASNAAVSTRA